MKYFYEYPVQKSDVDASRHIRLCDLERYLLETAGTSADRLGLGTNRLLEIYNTTWVLTRLSIMMDYLPTYDDTLVVETWIEGNAHMLSMRNFRLYVKKDEGNLLIGKCSSIWTLINMDSRQVDIAAFKDSAWDNAIDGERLEMPRAPRLGKIDEPTSVMTHTIRYSDLDFNNHCNSVKYLQFMLNACDALTGIFPIRLDMNYAKEVHKGEPTTISVLQSDNQVQYCMLNENDEISCTALLSRF